jgi:hypothetical protein
MRTAKSPLLRAARLPQQLSSRWVAGPGKTSQQPLPCPRHPGVTLPRTGASPFGGAAPRPGRSVAPGRAGQLGQVAASHVAPRQAESSPTRREQQHISREIRSNLPLAAQRFCRSGELVRPMSSPPHPGPGEVAGRWESNPFLRRHHLARLLSISLDGSDPARVRHLGRHRVLRRPPHPHGAWRSHPPAADIRISLPRLAGYPWRCCAAPPGGDRRTAQAPPRWCAGGSPWPRRAGEVGPRSSRLAELNHTSPALARLRPAHRGCISPHGCAPLGTPARTPPGEMTPPLAARAASADPARAVPPRPRWLCWPDSGALRFSSPWPLRLRPLPGAQTSVPWACPALPTFRWFSLPAADVPQPANQQHPSTSAPDLPGQAHPAGQHPLHENRRGEAWPGAGETEEKQTTTDESEATKQR